MKIRKLLIITAKSSSKRIKKKLSKQGIEIDFPKTKKLTKNNFTINTFNK
jgi:hypothetical protein